MKKLKIWWHKASTEILLLLGSFLIVGAMATISAIAAIYITGGALISSAYLLLKIGGEKKNYSE